MRVNFFHPVDGLVGNVGTKVLSLGSMFRFFEELHLFMESAVMEVTASILERS